MLSCGGWHRTVGALITSLFLDCDNSHTSQTPFITAPHTPSHTMEIGGNVGCVSRNPDREMIDDGHMEELGPGGTPPKRSVSTHIKHLQDMLQVCATAVLFCFVLFVFISLGNSSLRPPRGIERCKTPHPICLKLFVVSSPFVEVLADFSLRCFFWSERQIYGHLHCGKFPQTAFFEGILASLYKLFSSTHTNTTTVPTGVRSRRGRGVIRTCLVTTIPCA